MQNSAIKIGCLLLIIFSLAFGMRGQSDEWELADVATVRLEPRAFSILPKNIVEHLERRGCTIPQAFNDSKPHNVVQGQFRKAGQVDWAVLCSEGRVSSVLVFWKGGTSRVGEIASGKDQGFLQQMGDGKIGFSRTISVADGEYIRRQYKSYGGRKPPRSISHQGINDAFLEKASTVRYFYSDRWLELRGAD
jgi:hypothetical protein